MSKWIKCFRKQKEPKGEDAHSSKNGKVELNGYQQNPSKTNLAVARSGSNTASSNYSETDQPPEPTWATNPMANYEPVADSFISGLKTSHLAKEYSMKHEERGTAFIFNNTHFKNNFEHGADTLTARLGSDKDEKDLKDCFEKLGFKVEVYRNLSGEKFQDKLNEISQRDFSPVDCFVMIVMSHGHNHKITLSNGVEYPVNLIWEKFMPDKCRSLAGRPKLFFIQACRGKKYDHGYHITPPGAATSKDEIDSGTFSYAIPNAADILVSYSSPPEQVDQGSYWDYFKNMFCCTGFYSWRDTTHGSWFIQAICKVFNEHAFEFDILHLMTLVAQEVALHKTSVTDEPSTSGKRQVPSMTSTLIRQLKFTPKVKAPRGPLDCPVPMSIPTAPSRAPSNRSTNSTYPTYPPRLEAPPPLIRIFPNGVVTTAQVDIEQTEDTEEAQAEQELTSPILINGKVPLPKVKATAKPTAASTSQSNGNAEPVPNGSNATIDIDQEYV